MVFWRLQDWCLPLCTLVLAWPMARAAGRLLVSLRRSSTHGPCVAFSFLSPSALVLYSDTTLPPPPGICWAEDLLAHVAQWSLCASQLNVQAGRKQCEGARGAGLAGLALVLLRPEADASSAKTRKILSRSYPYQTFWRITWKSWVWLLVVTTESVAPKVFKTTKFGLFVLLRSLNMYWIYAAHRETKHRTGLHWNIWTL